MSVTPPLSASDIIAFRAKFGMTQRELAEGAGLTRGYIASVEQKRRAVTAYCSDAVGGLMQFFEKCDKDGRL